MNTLKFGNIELTYLKHAGFKIKGSRVVYIDPYDVSEGLEKADLILVTHDHFDHLDIKSIKRLSKSDTTVVTPRNCFVEGYDTCSLEEGEERVVKGVKVKTVPAY